MLGLWCATSPTSFASSVGALAPVYGYAGRRFWLFDCSCVQPDVLIGDESMSELRGALAAVAGISVKMHTPYE